MPDAPSIVELLERLARLEALVAERDAALVERDARIEALAAEYARLAQENAELRRRLGQSPRNSNLPPSSEGLAKPAPRSLRRRSGRRPGGQGGHEGTTLRQVQRPDVTRRHEPTTCAGCGDGLAGAAEVGVSCRQVFEIPEVRARVTEHRMVAHCYTAATHALCNAHLLRELVAAGELDAAATWAKQGIDALLALKDATEQATAAGVNRIDPQVLAEHIDRFRHAALVGVKDHADQRTKIGKKLHALARRMHGRIDDYLRFARDPRCPFDNNASERQVRMVKLRQKVSGCLRTLAGAERFCAIRSYLATAAMHGINLLDALVRLTSGRPWMPEIP